MAAAASTQVLKTRVILGGWAAIGGFAATSVYRTIRDFEESAPGIHDAIQELAASDAARGALGRGELSIARWPRSCCVDRFAGRARATFELRGDVGRVHVVMCAKRRPAAQEAFEARTEEEEDETAVGWRHYLSRPWELKLLLQSKLRPRREAAAEAAVEEPWDLDTLFFLPDGDVGKPQVLLGDPTALPEYEAMCVRRDGAAKDESSRRKLYAVLGLAVAGTVVAGGLRFVKSMRVSQSYGFVKRKLVEHGDVAAVLGPSAVVQKSEGTFGATYINARVRLIGSGGAVADVDVAATRDGSSTSPWRVALARMSHGGLTYSLDKSQF